MSILERSASPPALVDAPAPQSDRLRVITAGRVGNMEARLGTSGFDVVAVADTEEALIEAVSADDPDAIVVEADLCTSLKHVHDLAPDAVIIVVGDHTPAGALGRIERGVSGTVMAGLLHALVTEGVGAAVVWGLVPAIRPPGMPHLPDHVTGSLLSAKAKVVGDHVAATLRDHAPLAVVAATAVSVAAGVLLGMSSPRSHERTERPPVMAPAVQPGSERPVDAVSTTRTPLRRPSTGPGRGRHVHAPSEHGSPPGARTPPATSDASRPPGVANGWDIRPPKHADNGHRKGWTDNSVPDDRPPGKHNHAG